MKARTTTTLLLSLTFTLALVACGAPSSPFDTLELADHAADTDVAPAVPFDPSATTGDPPPPSEGSDELLDRELAAGNETAVEATVVDPDEPPSSPTLTASFTLRHGETLHHFARWAGLPVETVAETSGLDLSGSYSAGDTVVIPLDELEQRSTIESARDAHHTRRAEGYLASRGGAVGVEFITVRTGDSATSIAREQAGLPLWLVQTYNPSVDLDRIHPGQELMVPVVADIVVDAEDLPPTE